MTAITRRGALLGASAAVAVAAVPTIANARPDHLREGVQALVQEIRQGLSGQVIMCTYWGLQEAADRLEALPGIEAAPAESWPMKGLTLEKYGKTRVLRPARRVRP